MTVQSEPQDHERAALLKEVTASFARIQDPRLRELLTTTITHLHAFVFDAKLTPEEWRAGLDFLANVGRACTGTRHELMLLSDLLGVSTAVDRAGYNQAPGETPSSVEGPFYVAGSPDIPIGGSILTDDVGGIPTHMSGTVRTRGGAPVANAIVDVWQTAPNRLYAVTDDGQSDVNLRGRIHADEAGYYAFQTIRPVPYSVPTDGPCGAILRAVDGHGMRAAHIHVRVEAPGYQTLVTQIFPDDDPYLHSDTVFGVTDALVVPFKADTDSSEKRLSVTFDLVLKSTSRLC